jgi:hypothetical protein
VTGELRPSQPLRLYQELIIKRLLGSAGELIPMTELRDLGEEKDMLRTLGWLQKRARAIEVTGRCLWRGNGTTHDKGQAFVLDTEQAHVRVTDPAALATILRVWPERPPGPSRRERGLGPPAHRGPQWAGPEQPAAKPAPPALHAVPGATVLDNRHGAA